MENRTKEKGITLIETLIAVVIIGMAFIAIMSAQRQTISVSWQSREQMTAVNFARERIEVLTRYDDSGNDRVSAPWVAENTVENKDVDGIRYTVTTRVLPLTTQTNSTTDIFRHNDYIPVRVTVAWISHGKNNSISMDSCYVKTF